MTTVTTINGLSLEAVQGMVDLVKDLSPTRHSLRAVDFSSLLIVEG